MSAVSAVAGRPVAGGLSGPRVGAGYAVAGALAALAGAIALAGGEQDAGLVALARAAIVGIPLAVGWHASVTRRAGGFGAALIGLGLVLFVSVLAESDAGVPYIIGRIAGWMVEIVLVYLVLAFPHGRLHGRTDHLLVWAIALITAVFYVPQLFLAEQLPLPTPWTSCTDACPPNVLFALDTEPETLVALLRSSGALLVFALGVAVVARLLDRMSRSRSVTRRMVLPVLVVGVGRTIVLSVAIVARQVEADAGVIHAASWVLALSAPALALAFLLGLVRFQVFAGTALEQLNAAGAAADGPAGLERVLARELGDPDLRLLLPLDAEPGGWADVEGRQFRDPPAGGRQILTVAADGRLVAAVVHDPDLLLQPALVDAVSALVALRLQNERLAVEARTSLRELEASRARLLTSTERERKRIERDLHDGAQQRLVALRLELELLEDLVVRDPEAGRQRLRQLEQDVGEALDELRSLAHGVYPPVLADAGLVEAIREVAARTPIPVEVVVRGVGRYVPELESAVYFCVLEALQNALKHAAGLHRVVVTIDADGTELRFSVRDDGAGMDGVPGGERTGITGMRDRLTTLGGRLDVSSARDVGTTVRGVVPIRTDGTAS